MPKTLPDADIFGLNDMTNEKIAEIRRREKETLQFHKELVEQRKREELLNQIKEEE